MNEKSELRLVARLLGRLLVREIDDSLAKQLSTAAITEAFRELGMNLSTLSAGVSERAELDELAAEYFDVIIHPKDHAPLVQSLFETGRYEADAAASVRKIAAAAGLELDFDLARGAPPDHLGVQLLLWSELAERSSAAAEFAERHLAWAIRPLRLTAARGGFYGELASVVAKFIHEVLDTPSVQHPAET